MKVVSVVGARPQFVKLGAVAREFEADGGIEHIIVHTGQHYDPLMSEVFFTELGIPSAHVNLNVGSASHGVQTGAILSALDEVLARHKPDWTIVYGDTNSTLAGAVSAVKMDLRVAHVEAGLRSFNRRMPEEHNRVLTDHASDLLLAPTETALAHLVKEGLADRAQVVGDVMTDVCYRIRDIVKDSQALLPGTVDSSEPYIVATIHRAENTDNAARLSGIIECLRSLPVPTVLLAHPRLIARATNFGIELSGGALRATSPLGYPQMVRAVLGAVGVVTDSGGLQKEAFLLGVPCTTLRTETEWVETLSDGWNILDPQLEFVVRIAVRPIPTAVQAKPFGDGFAAKRILTALRERRID